MLDRQTTLRLLRRTAHDLVREVDLLPVEAALWRPAEGEWSLHEAVTHLRDIEHLVFLPRIQRVAAEDRPDLPYFDEVAYHKEHWSADEPLAKLLADFVRDRAAEVELLEKTEDWERTGQHQTRGPVTLAWLAEYAIGHTWEHLSQIMRVRLAHHTRHV